MSSADPPSPSSLFFTRSQPSAPYGALAPVVLQFRAPFTVSQTISVIQETGCHRPRAEGGERRMGPAQAWRCQEASVRATE